MLLPLLLPALELDNVLELFPADRLVKNDTGYELPYNRLYLKEIYFEKHENKTMKQCCTCVDYCWQMEEYENKTFEISVLQKFLLQI